MATSFVAGTNLDDPTIDRAVDDVRGAVRALQSRPGYQTIEVDLAIGTNTVKHGLGRAPSHVNVTPTVASAAFAWAADSTAAHPELQVTIIVVGAAQPGASVLVIA